MSTFLDRAVRTTNAGRSHRSVLIESVQAITGLGAPDVAGYDITTLRPRVGHPPMGSGPAEVVPVKILTSGDSR